MKKITKITIRRDIAVVSSRVLAEQLGKRHSDVLESIEKIIDEYNGNFRSTKNKNKTDISISLAASDLRALKNKENIYFIKAKYKANNGKMNPEYLLTQKGFTLYMFNIQGYNDFKITYINDFERMASILRNKKDPEFLAIEEQGKTIRKNEADHIFVGELIFYFY